MNELRMERNASLAAYRKEFEKNRRDADKLIDALTRGVDASLVKDRLNALSARQKELTQLLETTPEAPVLLHPAMAQKYETEVRTLLQSLNEPEHRAESAQIVRPLVERVKLTPNEEGNGLLVDLHGDLAGILQVATTGKVALAQKETAPQGSGSVNTPISGKMVAGAGFEPATFRL